METITVLGAFIGGMVLLVGMDAAIVKKIKEKDEKTID